MTPNPIAYIAVHGGAGVHALKHEKEIKRALRKACTYALSVTETSNSPGHADSKNIHTSLTMVEYAIQVLEDDEHFNAGRGSNLTIDGTVECDAAIMDGKGTFGSVGAVSGCKNPIQLARTVLDHSRVPDRLGRVPPLTLVSSGAYYFAAATGQVETVPPEALITPRSYEHWKKWKNRLDSSENSSTWIDTTDERLEDIQDTVGAVVWHGSSGLAAGVSSGGLLLKFPGRVGEAAIFGAGCWASQYEPGPIDGMACSISGTGEHIIRASLARRLGEALRVAVQSDKGADPHNILNHILAEDFGDTSRGLGENNPSAGIILLTAEGNDSGDAKVRLWCAFTTPSMAVAYTSTKNPTPKAIVFRRPDNDRIPGGKPRIFITSLPL